jgi:predicted phosphate transport protein (TIGR00153 family)
MSDADIGPVRRVVRVITQSESQSLIAPLERQLVVTIAACAIAREVAEGKRTPAEAHEKIADIEHTGDLLRGKFVGKLTHVLVAPIDREDLFRLSRSIDDVLDNLRDFVREWDLFDVATKDPYLHLLDATASALEDLRLAVQTIGRDPKKLTSHTALATKKSANEIRRKYDEELAKLFQRKLTMKVLKIRELLRRLDVVGLRLNEAADVLADAAVKRRA